MTNQYDEWHATMALAEEASVKALDPWHVTVLGLLPDLNGKRVLEIGCGRGDFAILLARRYPSVEITGLDFSSTAIEVANAKLAGTSLPVVFRVDDAENLHLDSHSFDYIISCECLEHVPRPKSMAKEMARCLKRGGGFVLTTENYFNGMLLAWLVTWLRNEPFDSGAGVQPHENFFVFWRVKRILESAGLAVTHMQSNYFQWLLLPRIAPRKLCTKRFKRRWLNRMFLPFGRHFTFQGVNRADLFSTQ